MRNRLDADNLRQWLHRIEEAVNQDRTRLGRAVYKAAQDALMRNLPAPKGPGLLLAVDSALPPIQIERDAIAEVLTGLGYLSNALSLLPYRSALEPIRRLGEIADTLQDAFPGGGAGKCMVCERWVGIDEIGIHDHERGQPTCRYCAAEIEAGDVDAVDRAKAEDDSARAAVEGDAGAAANRALVFGADVTKDGINISGPWAAGEDTIVAHGQPTGPAPEGDPTKLAAMRHATERQVPKFDPAAKINWGNASEAAQAIKGGFLPEGFAVEDGVLIVPGVEFRSWRSASALFAAFDAIRKRDGTVLKSKDPNWAPPEGEERQLLRQLMRGPVLIRHSASYAIAERLEEKGEAMTFPPGAGGGLILDITAKGKRRLIEAGRIEAPIDPVGLADAIAGLSPYETENGKQLVPIQMSPDRRDFVVAKLREAANG